MPFALYAALATCSCRQGRKKRLAVLSATVFWQLCDTGVCGRSTRCQARGPCFGCAARRARRTARLRGLTRRRADSSSCTPKCWTATICSRTVVASLEGYGCDGPPHPRRQGLSQPRLTETGSNLDQRPHAPQVSHRPRSRADGWTTGRSAALGPVSILPVQRRPDAMRQLGCCLINPAATYS